jgi:hypothetical protein
MSARRHRAIFLAMAVIGGVWLLACGGYFYFQSSKPTAEKLAQYLQSTDLNRLSGKARADALRNLGRQMTALSMEERRRARMAGEWERWFTAMTDDEKVTFVEATLPSGFKQMIQSFEQLPEERRKRAIEITVRDLQRVQERVASEDPNFARRMAGRTNAMANLTPQVQQKIVKIGLKSFYTESSAQSKAELAPVLEELQRAMERGRLFHGRN